MIPATILVIEDEAIQTLLLTVHLEAHGYRVLSAGNGMEGLRKAREARPDLIVLDLSLPGLSGEELLKRLKADEAARETPIIIVTAFRLADLPAEQATYCVSKPYQLDVLREMIEDTLTRFPQERLIRSLP